MTPVRVDVVAMEIYVTDHHQGACLLIAVIYIPHFRPRDRNPCTITDALMYWNLAAMGRSKRGVDRL